MQQRQSNPLPSSSDQAPIVAPGVIGVNLCSAACPRQPVPTHIVSGRRAVLVQTTANIYYPPRATLTHFHARSPTALRFNQTYLVCGRRSMLLGGAAVAPVLPTDTGGFYQ